ncbi:hypothetical protein B0H17DRAFT_1154174 [Mycena rosella]|uniref:Uncharacterized protein n=1 Tax=Mycena rosella TaxID=1033263 RepID=A0AAD7F6Y6_MYCRO|nr:hypothetical protein B0H17DRAFT_1154174 [Mycena rosella]
MQRDDAEAKLEVDGGPIHSTNPLAFLPLQTNILPHLTHVQGNSTFTARRTPHMRNVRDTVEEEVDLRTVQRTQDGAAYPARQGAGARSGEAWGIQHPRGLVLSLLRRRDSAHPMRCRRAEYCVGASRVWEGRLGRYGVTADGGVYGRGELQEGVHVRRRMTGD